MRPSYLLGSLWLLVACVALSGGGKALPVQSGVVDGVQQAQTYTLPGLSSTTIAAAGTYTVGTSFTTGTAQANHIYVGLSMSGAILGTVTLNLPTGDHPGQILSIYANNSISVVAYGGASQIGGWTSLLLTLPYESFVWNGSAWQRFS